MKTKSRNHYCSLTGFFLLLIGALSACESDDTATPPNWTEEDFYSPQTDGLPSDSLVLAVADGSFANRRESIEEIADRLGLTVFPASDTLVPVEDRRSFPAPFSFRIYSAEVDNDGQFIGYLPGLSDASLSDSVRGWTYQSGRYVFRFQESASHRFVSVAEKITEQRVTDAQGQQFTVANRSSARLYVDDEQIVDATTGLKRERLTFAGKVDQLAELYPELALPAETVAISDYRYDTVLADSLDDGTINEKRVRLLLVVSD